MRKFLLFAIPLIALGIVVIVKVIPAAMPAGAESQATPTPRIIAPTLTATPASQDTPLPDYTATVQAYQDGQLLDRAALIERGRTEQAIQSTAARVRELEHIAGTGTAWAMQVTSTEQAYQHYLGTPTAEARATSTSYSMHATQQAHDDVMTSQSQDFTLQVLMLVAVILTAAALLVWGFVAVWTLRKEAKSEN